MRVSAHSCKQKKKNNLLPFISSWNREFRASPSLFYSLLHLVTSLLIIVRVSSINKLFVSSVIIYTFLHKWFFEISFNRRIHPHLVSSTLMYIYSFTPCRTNFINLQFHSKNKKKKKDSQIHANIKISRHISKFLIYIQPLFFSLHSIIPNILSLASRIYILIKSTLTYLS